MACFECGEEIGYGVGELQELCLECLEKALDVELEACECGKLCESHEVDGDGLCIDCR